MAEKKLVCAIKANFLNGVFSDDDNTNIKAKYAEEVTGIKDTAFAPGYGTQGNLDCNLKGNTPENKAL